MNIRALQVGLLSTALACLPAGRALAQEEPGEGTTIKIEDTGSRKWTFKLTTTTSAGGIHKFSRNMPVDMTSLAFFKPKPGSDKGQNITSIMDTFVVQNGDTCELKVKNTDKEKKKNRIVRFTLTDDTANKDQATFVLVSSKGKLWVVLESAAFVDLEDPMLVIETNKPEPGSITLKDPVKPE